MEEKMLIDVERKREEGYIVVKSYSGNSTYSLNLQTGEYNEDSNRGFNAFGNGKLEKKDIGSVVRTYKR